MCCRIGARFAGERFADAAAKRVYSRTQYIRATVTASYHDGPWSAQLALSGPAPREEIARHGWQLVDAAERSSTMERYRDYVAGSRAEWSIAKEAYVASRSGWFSCRSACYLAMGKPVVVEDTGFSRIYPQREGIFGFRSIEEAAAGIDAIEGDYRRQCEAARATAERFFRAETVLEKLLHDAGL